MLFNESVLKSDEKAIFSLRDLYRKYGYAPYKMSKFEEYELYVRNKDFLVSDHIITFTNQSGRLMALKPDVTLSIIKNGEDHPGCVQKVYYNENVYRADKGTGDYKEIMQVGLECIGDIDTYNLYEAVMLAAKSLALIAEDCGVPACVLDISHMGIVTAMLDALHLNAEERTLLLKCIGEKSLHEIEAVCRAAGAKEDATRRLLDLIAVYGNPETVLPKLQALCRGTAAEKAYDDFASVVCAVEKAETNTVLHIDFSVVNDMNYYNGIVFRGFMEGIPTGILSGGQYDKLVEKMGRNSGAIGFAVYLDMLERLGYSAETYDVDTLILYEEGADLADLNNAVRMLTDSGHSVMTQKAVPEKLRCKQILRLREKGVEIVETHA